MKQSLRFNVNNFYIFTHLRSILKCIESRQKYSCFFEPFFFIICANLIRNLILETIQKKIESLKQIFLPLSTEEEKYKKIIEMGSILALFPDEEKKEDNLVDGCQSLLYLHIQVKNGKAQLKIDSDALISKGLAALIFFVYNDQPLKEIIITPPKFLNDLGILKSLSPNRATGVISLYSKIQKNCLSLA